MVDPFGEISFLTRSENRVTILETLSGGTHTEYELVEETGISDVTVGRVVEDFRDRGWIRATEDGYETTRLGDLLAADYARLRDSMDLACRLGPVRDLLPIEEMDFDLRHLTGARISDPEAFNPLRTLDRWTELVYGADRVVGVAPAANAAEVVVEPFHEAVTENDLEFGVVVSSEYFETVSGRPDLRELLRDIIRAGAEMYLAPEEADIDYSVAAFDDVAAISGFDETGSLRVGIETRADPVREWVCDTYERYREGATRLDVEDLPE